VISQARFFGGGKYKAISASLTINQHEARCYAIKATGAQNVVLPDARTIPTGGPIFIIMNVAGGAALQIKTADGVNVGASLTAGFVFEAYLTDNSTITGTWTGRARSIGTGAGNPFVFRRFFVNSGSPVGSLSIWTPFPTNTWAAGNAGQVHRECGAFVLGQDYFVVGDFPITGSVTTSDYNTLTTAWTVRPAAPFQTGQCAAASSVRRDFGEIYGGAGNGATKTMRYVRGGGSSLGGVWTGRSAQPIGKTRFSAVMIEGRERVIVMGGEPEPTPNLARNIYTDTWWTIANHVSPFRHSIATFQINGLAYAVGGRTEIAPITRFQQLDEYNPVNDTWIARSALSLGARWGGAGVSANGAGFYLSGQDNADTASTSCVRYQQDTWSAIAAMNVARTGIGSMGGAMR
jgi:hypothetical protein